MGEPTHGLTPFQLERLAERQSARIRALTEQIAAVRALHTIWNDGQDLCDRCGQFWPCETISIIGEGER